MTTRLPVVATTVLAAFIAGCADKPVAHTARKVPVDTSEDLPQSKDEFEKMLKSKLETLEGEVRELREKAERLEQSARTKWAEEMSELEAKRKAAWEKLDRVATSTGEAWKSLREGATNAWQELEKAIHEARSKF